MRSQESYVPSAPPSICQVTPWVCFHIYKTGVWTEWFLEVIHLQHSLVLRLTRVRNQTVANLTLLCYHSCFFLESFCLACNSLVSQWVLCENTTHLVWAKPCGSSIPYWLLLCTRKKIKWYVIVVICWTLSSFSYPLVLASTILSNL